MYCATVAYKLLLHLHFVTKVELKKKIERPQDVAQTLPSSPESLRSHQRGSFKLKYNYSFAQNGKDSATYTAPRIWGRSVFFLRGFDIRFRTM